jgi:hypothetical protein
LEPLGAALAFGFVTFAAGALGGEADGGSGFGLGAGATVIPFGCTAGLTS